MGILWLQKKTKVKRNKNGAVVSGVRVLRREEYGNGRFYPNGEPGVDYSRWLQNADSYGFDVTRLMENGQYCMVVELPYGTKVIRYGGANGFYTAPAGTKFEELSLPYEEQSCEYHEYMVIANSVKVLCIVTKGFIAPGFHCVGGGIQYVHEKSIFQCMDMGELKEVTKWEKE